MSVQQVRFGVVVHAFDEASKKFMENDLSAVGLEDHDMYTVPLATPPIGIPPGWALAAYRIPYFTPTGELLEGMYRDKIQYRDTITKAQLREAGVGKYIGPPGPALRARNLTTTEPYLYPWVGPSRVLCICEGEKKAAKVSNDWKVRAIGIGGKDMWGEREGGRVVHTRIVQAIEASEAEEILIIADPDINESDDVRRSYADFYFRLRGQFPALTIRVVVPPSEDLKVDDWLHAEGGEIGDLIDIAGLELERGIEILTEEFDLLRKHTARGWGGLEANLYNVFQLIHNHPSLKQSWRYNEDSNKIEYNGKPHRSDDILRVQSLLQRSLHLPSIGKHIVEDAIQREALENSYSPSYDEIMSIDHWDGKDRLGEEYWGLDSGAMPVIRALVCGYVKRVLYPGCHWRIMPILCGPNGVGKTGLANWLVGDGVVYELHKGQLVREDKDSTRYTMQAGVLRIDDLDSFGGAEIGRLKAMVTAREAVMRMAYAKEDTVFKRRSIMMATTNHRYIIPDDPTGNTRFAAAWIGHKFPFDKLNAERLQILCQAREMVDIDYMPTDIDFEAMKEYRESSPIREKLEDFLDDLRTGEVKADNVTIWRTGKGWYFKVERFWLFAGRENPNVYDNKNFKQLAIEYKLTYHGKEDRVSIGGQRLKNIYHVNLAP